MKTKFNQPYLRVALIGVFALISALIPNCVFAQKYHSHIIERGDTLNAGLQFLQLNGKYYINEFYRCNTHAFGCHRIIEINPNGRDLKFSEEIKAVSEKGMMAVDANKNRLVVLGNFKENNTSSSTVKIVLVDPSTLKISKILDFPEIDSLLYVVPHFIVHSKNNWYVGVNGQNTVTKRNQLCLLKLNDEFQLDLLTKIYLPYGSQLLHEAYMDSNNNLKVHYHFDNNVNGSKSVIATYDENLHLLISHTSGYASIRQLPVGMEIPGNKTLFAIITDLGTLSAELHVLDSQNNVNKMTPWNAQPGQLREIEKLIYSKDGNYIGGGKYADATTGPLGNLLLFFKVNTSGTLVFERYFVMDNIYQYGKYPDINDIIELEDGSFLVVGRLQTFKPNENNTLELSSDLIWMRLSPLGCFSDESCLIEVNIENTIVGTSNENQSSLESSHLFANPAFDQISFSGNYPPNEIRFSNIMGKSSTLTSSTSGTFDISSLPSGLYVASWTEENRLRSQKILILK
ncbi:MAG: T9SS type A sorting domain-containing protein [Saprospiraceae bacterium]|nr:T9SS type A sorting domain-containing protein [Saprospiraceae bacterium]